MLEPGIKEKGIALLKYDLMAVKDHFHRALEEIVEFLSGMVVKMRLKFFGLGFDIDQENLGFFMDKIIGQVLVFVIFSSVREGAGPFFDQAVSMQPGFNAG